MRLTSRVLVLTDVVGSADLAESRLPDSEQLASHNRIARDLVRRFGGREIDHAEGFLLMFDDVESAVRFAFDYQVELGGVGMRARIGIHLGEVALLHNTARDVALGAKPLEVEGVTKPIAARVLSIATPGQTLLTAAARAVLGPIPQQVESHGHWLLKGVSEPMEIYEIGQTGAVFSPPPDQPKAYRVVRNGDAWLPRREIPKNLPAERDSFVGRGQDLVALAKLLGDGERLVSVLGIGGTGKTRLVTRFGWLWLGDFPGGCFFCDLSEARTLEGIGYAVARALDVQLRAGDPIVQLGHAIAGRGDCLLILDNFEQVAQFAAESVGAWLERAPDARFVVTSRERTGIARESVLLLAPLEVLDGIALFVERAQQVDGGFTLSEADLPVVEELISLLDSLPLAIELAAARVNLMRPKTLLARMGQRFKLLSSSGSRPSRQATLRGALDWSWDLLNADERRALTQLSVFDGGFTLEAAEAVLQLPEMWPADAVQSLIDKSLVRVLGASPQRMDLMESVQAYAGEKLSEREETEVRHGVWCASLGSPEALAGLLRFGGVARRRALTLELDNLSVGWSRAVARGDGTVAVAALDAATEILLVTGPLQALTAMAERVLELPGLSETERARARERLADGLAMSASRTAAQALYEQALATYRESGQREGVSRVLGKIGRASTEEHDFPRAERELLESLKISREIGERSIETKAMAHLGVMYNHWLGEEDETALDFYNGALALTRQTGDRLAEGSALTNLGIHLSERHQEQLGYALVLQGLAIHREVGNRRSEAIALAAMAFQADLDGDREQALAMYAQSVALQRRLGNRGGEGTCLANMGVIYKESGRTEEALRHFELALGAHRDAGNEFNVANVLNNAAGAYLALGDLVRARSYAEQSLALAMEVGFEAKVTAARATLVEVARRAALQS